MATTAARSRAHERVDIPSFVDNIRAFNRTAVRIFNAPSNRGAELYRRQELADVLGELEETVKVLRVATVRPSSAARRPPAARSAARQQEAPEAPALDTTAVMVDKGQLVTPVEFQQLMGWATRQAVWKAADSHRVFYLTHKAERYFPAFYGDPVYERRHLEAVTKVLGDLPGGSKLQFFLTRKGSLGGDTPLQALAAGRVAKVKDVAAAFAEVPAAG